MEQLSDYKVIRELQERYGFSFSKSLGQNFLINPSVCPRMAELSGADFETNVLEIGPGIGVLTAELCKRARRVVSIELDRRLIPILDATMAEFSNFSLVQGDVLKLDLPKLLAQEFGGQPTVVCANLPYYITSPVIMRLLESRLPIQAVTVMVQKEAAQRLCAEVGTRAAGAVTVAVSYYAHAQELFEVSRGSFYPAPHVDSAVIRLNIREKPPVSVANESGFFRVVKAGFGQRRKTLCNALSSGLSLDKKAISAAIQAVGLSPTVRAEQLSIQQLAALSNALFF